MKKVWWLLIVLVALPVLAFDDDEAEKVRAATEAVARQILHKLPDGCSITCMPNRCVVRLSTEVPRSVMIKAADEVRATLPEGSPITIHVLSVDFEVQLRLEHIARVEAEIEGIREMGDK